MHPSPSSHRVHMVWDQLARRGIRDQRVLDAMSRVPRENFVPPEKADMAYEDTALSIGCNQTISQPYMVALTLEALELDEDHKVLEVGTGSGYQTALLLELVGEVISIEVIPELAQEAERRLSSMGYENFNIVVGDGSKGFSPHAPYHRIAVAAAAPDVPPSLEDQLDEGGILVLPVGSRVCQNLRRVIRKKGSFHYEDLCPCVYVPLIGEEGWANGWESRTEGGGRVREG